MYLKTLMEWAERHKPALVMTAFLSGVAIHSFFPLVTVPTATWWVLGIALVLLFLISGFRVKPGMTKVALVVACLVVGLWRFDAAVPVQIRSVGNAEYEATVQDVTDGMYGKQGMAVLESGMNVQLTLKRDVAVGSRIGFSCALKPIEQKPDELDRRFASRLHKMQAQCTPKDLIVVAYPPWWDVRQMFADLRVQTNRRIMSVLPGEEGALIAGMLYGERGMSQKSNDLFRRAGLTHLIAVSGSNITIVASIVFAILLGCGLWRRQAFWLTTFVLGSYVMFTGFSASVARAAVMGWLVLLARHIGRQPLTWHMLLVSAFVLCLLDPWMLAFDAGFALSFLATMGLMVWSPIFDKQLGFLPAVGGLREAAATTFAATFMTTPYLAFAFERISLAGLITNVVAVPLVPWAMLFGAVSAAWGNFFGWQVVSLPASGVAKIIFLSARVADFVPWLSIPMQSMNFILLLATYGLVAWIWFWLRAKKSFSTKDRCVLSEHG
jgi:ComEC/Rec2-related protein